MKNIDKARNYLIEKINQNELMGKKHQNVYRVLNHIEVKIVNFTMSQWNHFLRIMIWKCIQHKMKKNQLLLKDSFEP